ncbi:MAG: homoserine dehydrogenase [Planctomycetaceae bacterium]|nr:homoserine dehydrogenase [Planctomycetaceae bacterium]
MSKNSGVLKRQRFGYNTDSCGRYRRFINFTKTALSAPVKIALLGFGTIGTGVAKILLNNAARIAQAAGRNVELARICDKDIRTPRDISVPENILTAGIESVINDPAISIAVELIGGLEPARTFVLRLLESGKDIVTANKALLASHGAELFETARKHGRTIAFEAAVCGGIPILNALSTALQANTLQSINAIVNGTSNYILSQMESGQTSYQEAVKQAQQLGYAEADPAMDVDGTDAVQKLTILAQLGFGVAVNWKDISRIGIESVDAIDFRYAKELGYRIKLIAAAVRSNGGLELHVSPTLVKADNPLARVKDAFNALRIVGDSVGPVFFQGLGAGQLPTASAVVGDVIDTVLGRTAITFKALNLWGKETADSGRQSAAVKSPQEFFGKSYLRLNVKDQPGMMHEISGVLSKLGISIASMIQHEPETKNGGEPAVLILTTHETREGDLLKAIQALENSPAVLEKVVRLRVQG